MVKRILQYFRRETVLSAALVCALLSFLLPPPSVIHLQGIDTTTLLMLFSLMTIVAGFRRMGALDAVSRKLTRRVTTLRGLSAVMVALCFVLSMLVTNDVALLTLVPLTLLLFRAGGQKSTIWTVVLETVAANLGSMVTPIGNPQNLYLYTSGRLTALDFLTLLAPYAAVALALLLALCLLLPKERVAVDTSARAPLAGKMLTLYGALSALALLAIAKVLPAWALAGGGGYAGAGQGDNPAGGLHAAGDVRVLLCLCGIGEGVRAGARVAGSDDGAQPDGGGIADESGHQQRAGVPAAVAVHAGRESAGAGR
mgnify:CR=1 FL=1